MQLKEKRGESGFVFPANHHFSSKATSASGQAVHAVDEINAYIAIRDNLLAEAEEIRTRAKLDSLCVANDFVETCLRPARSPYQAQCLPETDAVRERERCRAVKARIAELRVHVAIDRHRHARALAR